MLPSLLLAFSLGVVECGIEPSGTAPVAGLPAPRADSALVALYESGVTFEAFLGGVRARREMWTRNWERSTVPPDVLARAQAIPGRWRLLISAADTCGDSANTIPYLARLLEQVPSIGMRIVGPVEGRSFMERHRTPDGRAATPTLILIDEAGEEMGCWVERPAALQALVAELRATGRAEGLSREVFGWYDADAGASTLREVIAIIASAAQGEPGCRPLSEPQFGT